MQFNENHVSALSASYAPATLSLSTLVALIRRESDPRSTDRAKVASAIRTFLTDVQIPFRAYNGITRSDIAKIVAWCEAVAYNATAADLECADNMLAYNTHNALTALVLA
jgi:hypothetical protein